MDNPAIKSIKGFPSEIRFIIEPTGNQLTVISRSDASMRQIDPWALAYLRNWEALNCLTINTIIFKIISRSKDDTPSIEAFIRRVSFLSLVNKIRFAVQIDGAERKLYDQDSLLSRTGTEIIRDYRKLKQRGDTDKPGRLEKDFQTFLFGKGLDKTSRTNERLAIIGEDFYKLGKKGFKIIREFPTGAFTQKILKSNRILPTDYIDILTLNKYGELSLIELKLNDPKLEVISQILDYALFFKCYYKQLRRYLDSEFEGRIKSSKIVAYIANNYFHPKFNSIRNFYQGDKLGIEIKTSTLGFTEKCSETGNSPRIP